jgi:hypothetical protein
MSYELNGQPIDITRPYTAPNGVKYPHLKDSAIRQQLGVVESEPAPEFNENFYDAPNTPKPLSDLKAKWVADFKIEANILLRKTDWMVIRKFERDVAIPESVATTRAAIIAEADRLETAIAGCADVEALIAVVGSQDWPKE